MQTVENEIPFGARDEECGSETDVVKPSEIQVAAIHDVEGSGLEDQLIQEMDVVNSPVCDDDNRRNIAAQVQHGVEFHGSLVLAEARPGKQGKTQIDRRSIECVDRLLELDTKLWPT